MKLYTKYESSRSFSFEQEDFLKPFCWPCDLLMQTIGSVWKILVGDHLGIISVEFGQISINGLSTLFTTFFVWTSLQFILGKEVFLI